jgi:phosphoribosylamine--glycine ligase
MKVLVIGRGGREHALAWKLACSSRAEKVFVGPGNAGTIGGPGGKIIPAKLDPLDFQACVAFCKAESIGLVVVGPEDPLAAGIVDALESEKIRVFGPSKAAAQLEASKVFSKSLMREALVPTADFQVCDHPQIARTYIDSQIEPLVIKADGLAAGKGVIVCDNAEQARRAVDRIMVREEFGKGVGRQVVIERRLQGQELSVLALVSGRCVMRLEAAQDHKAAFDGDKGPNTGGMGAYSPAPIATPEILEKIDEEVFIPTIHAMKRRKSPYKGCLYAGMMLCPQGPKVLEFNCRLGDPETQPVLMRLKTDLLDLLEAVVDERLEEFADKVAWDPRPAICVVLAAQGYPGSYQKGTPIHGLEAASKLPDVQVFHAGTARNARGEVVTDGGRVLGVTAMGDTIELARKNAYEAIKLIKFTGMQFRADIGRKALATPRNN